MLGSTMAMAVFHSGPSHSSSRKGFKSSFRSVDGPTSPLQNLHTSPATLAHSDHCYWTHSAEKWRETESSECERRECFKRYSEYLFYLIVSINKVIQMLILACIQYFQWKQSRLYKLRVLNLYLDL